MGTPTKTAKHTPTPWRDTFRSDGERGVRADSGYICFLPQPTHYHGQDDRYEQELEETKANAKIIVKAVNLHAEMLEALKKCHEYFDDRYDGAPDGGCQAMVEPMEAARIAIAKAEAK